MELEVRSIRPLNLGRHKPLRWHRFPDYQFAGDRDLVVVAALEVAHAALAMPLTFVQQQDRWSLCALLGLSSGQNLYVGPDGRWISAYIPASLRSHPFYLDWRGSEATLCIDEESGLLVGDSSGEPLFDENGELSEPLSQVWGFLSTIAQSILVAEEICGQLAVSGVLESWPITVRAAGRERTLAGLYRISEASLNNLDPAAFIKLRESGALSIAYAQLISMGNLPDLGKLAHARNQADEQASINAARRVSAQPLINLPDDSTIDWDWSKIGR